MESAKKMFQEIKNQLINAKCNNVSIAEFENLPNEMDQVPWYCINCVIDKNVSIFFFWK